MATGGMESPGVDPAEAERPRGAPGRLAAGRRAARERLRDTVRHARSAAIRGVRLVFLYSIVAGLSVGAGLLVVTLYDEYGYHPIRNTTVWAGQPLRYAVGDDCTGCHEPQATAIAEREHAVINCQACHGPLAEHVRTGGPVLATAAEPAVTAAVCLTCHEDVAGRPAAFPVVAKATHFGGAPCLLCHEPHRTAALAPPRVLHPLEGLPDCLVCHGPEGLRPMPAGHPDWPEGDCLGCHLRRGTVTP